MLNLKHLNKQKLLAISIDFVKTVKEIPFSMTDSNVISFLSLDNCLCILPII